MAEPMQLYAVPLQCALVRFVGNVAAMEESEIHNLIESAVAALGDGDYVRAFGHWRSTSGRSARPGGGSSYSRQALLGADAPEEAYEEAQRAVELAPGDEHAHRLVAMSAWRNGRLAIAQEAFERAIAICGPLPALLSDYAWFMATERGPKLAKEAAEAAVEADANSSTAWAALGLAQYRLHRRDRGRSQSPPGLQLNPNDIYAQSAMVALLQDRRQDSKAEALVGLLEEHAGTEDLVAAVRDEAKRRQIGRMLVERKVDVERAGPRATELLLGLGIGRRHARRPPVLVLRSDVLADCYNVRGHLIDCAAIG